MNVLIVNFKNYPEVLGKGSLLLARAAERAASATGAEIIVAPPTPMLSLVASKSSVRVFSQSVGPDSGDRSTGAILPEAVKAAGAQGTILNHSESRLPPTTLKALVPRVAGIGLEVCLCARTSREAASLAALKSEYLAVEPPELISSGMAVSMAQPEIVRRTVSAARAAGYRGKILCGAGIISGPDVRRAIELGAEGVLVASGVVKAKDWENKILELSRSLM